MKRRQSTAVSLHAARLDALGKVRDAEARVAEARAAFATADAAWRDHLREERNRERATA